MYLRQEYLRDDVVSVSVHHIRGYMMLVCFDSGDITFNTLVRWCLPDFSIVKSLFSPVYL